MICWEKKKSLLISIKKNIIILKRVLTDLNTELLAKKHLVEETINTAGRAYYNRNRAEDELKKL